MAILTIAGYQMSITSTLRATSGVEVGRNHALKSLLRYIEIEQGQHQTSFSRVESYLSFVSIDKTTFRTARPSIRSADNMEDSFSHSACFRETLGLNQCFGACPSTTDHRLDTGDSTSRSVSHIEDASIGQGPKCVLSCTIPALDRHLSNGMAEDRLLCPIRAPRFYLERFMPWREHKRLLFVSFKPGHKRDIVPSTISGWIRKMILECNTNSPTPLLDSHKVKAHQVRAMAASLAFHRQASMEQILRAGTWFCHNTVTDFYLKALSLYTGDLSQLGLVVAAEPILHPTGDHCLYPTIHSPRFCTL